MFVIDNLSNMLCAVFPGHRELLKTPKKVKIGSLEVILQAHTARDCLFGYYYSRWADLTVVVSYHARIRLACKFTVIPIKSLLANGF